METIERIETSDETVNLIILKDLFFRKFLIRLMRIKKIVNFYNLKIKQEKIKKSDEGKSGELKKVHKVRRDHSNSRISNNEKEIIQKIKTKEEKGQKEAMRKLLWVSLIGVLFMTGEFVGGYLSHSTAIMSDAAHMLSDFLGFGISMISIITSRKQPTTKLSFGYHRAEIVGALVSVV